MIVDASLRAVVLESLHRYVVEEDSTVDVARFVGWLQERRPVLRYVDPTLLESIAEELCRWRTDGPAAHTRTVGPGMA